ncbi:Smr/MutS family protein [Xanthomarina sp. F2636L]|uniref:Smr/MutS family protein n=1 Tax=Xanthomarina sp. F2636L TaxID=2996018 RepID=UPI00225DFD1B|nr:Smr/MutS family protein [Xanthomarina sp. F2636L]MCX7550431.1 DNA mismatch repair protein MutS [Xanthomarina sp. F2636L]
MFKVGNKVSVLDEDLTGFIVKIVGDTITVEDVHGFEMDFNKKELVLIKNKSDLKSKSFVDVSFNEVLSEKEEQKRKPSVRKKVKERFEPTMEVDLHIHQLTDKSGRMSNHDMLTLQLDTARKQLEFAIRNRIQKVVFIHGVGEGVLRIELEYLFGRYNNVKFYDANYQKYGLGATEVYIFQNVATD